MVKSEVIGKSTSDVAFFTCFALRDASGYSKGLLLRRVSFLEMDWNQCQLQALRELLTVRERELIEPKSSPGPVQIHGSNHKKDRFSVEMECWLSEEKNSPTEESDRLAANL